MEDAAALNEPSSSSRPSSQRLEKMGVPTGQEGSRKTSNGRRGVQHRAPLDRAAKGATAGEATVDEYKAVREGVRSLPPGGRKGA
jgi:hypothetical protein